MLCLKDDLGNGVGAPKGERTRARAGPGSPGEFSWASGADAAQEAGLRCRRAGGGPLGGEP